MMRSWTQPRQVGEVGPRPVYSCDPKTNGAMLVVLDLDGIYPAPDLLFCLWMQLQKLYDDILVIGPQCLRGPVRIENSTDELARLRFGSKDIGAEFDPA